MICTGDDALYTFSYSADEGIWPFMMWDGASWHPIPPPLLTWIGGMAFHDHHLYVAGVSAGDIAIARYDGSEWEEFRGSGRDTTGERFVHARTLIDYDGELVAGGGFAASRGVTLNNVASVRLLTVGVPGAAAQENIAIAPNPSAGWVRVDGRLRDGGSIAVLDMLGRRVMEAPASRALDLGELPNGAYMLAIPTREGMAIRRIVLER